MERLSVKPNIIGQMMPHQIKLVDRYIEVYGLPSYPVNLNDHKSQEWLKQILGNFLEETAEAYQVLEKVFVSVSENRLEEAQDGLRAYNEEMADAWHFLLEFLMYMGIDDVSLDIMLQGWIKDIDERLSNFYLVGNPFKSLLLVAGFYNQQSGFKSVMNKPDRFTIASDLEAADDFMLAGARRLSKRLMLDHCILLWWVTYRVGLVRNLLKNRHWTSEHRETNMVQIKDQICHLMLAWASYMDFAGFNEISIYNAYCQKNIENHERLNHKY